MGKRWTDSGETHDDRGLKNRPVEEVRPVPIPPHLVAILRDHIDTFGVTDEGQLARDAQGEIIRGAKVVATTLARFGTTKPVFEGEYDVVLIDEAGAATLLEVLLAVVKARTTAVLLGDLMQLGPVLPELDGE